MPSARPPADDKLIFILDIGTRSVVGLAGRMQGEQFVVEAHEAEPHPHRAMIDGQIEDIDQVAQVAGAVKARLEEKLGLGLHRVSVAAAGRALKTTRASAELPISLALPITAQTVFQLENNAINAARTQLEEDLGDTPYTCVGHSVVQYQLDGYPFSSILEHHGSLASVSIIASFLPTEVVQSLRHCMDRLDLEIDSLTLEPIAAMRAIIPADIRLLNLALVDIGAGTSDIALSRDGSVAGFTMATVAGDEITEAIIKALLVGFTTAEGIKMALNGPGPIPYKDILGFEHEQNPQELLQAIEPAVDALAQMVADKITECNDGPPHAVFLVGGGSRTPGLVAKLSEKLSMEANRVALAGSKFSGLEGPEYATPVGIALIAADNAEKSGASVSINGARVRLFTGQAASVMDALLMGGYRYSDLMGRNGRSLTFTLNGVRTVLRGGPYTAAELSLNGLPASLSTPVENGDVIDIVPATSGENAHATVEDYANGEKPLTVSLNGRKLAAGFVALLGGASVPPETPIREQDEVEVYTVHTVAELCEAAGLTLEEEPILVNGKECGPTATLADGDVIEIRLAEASMPEAPAAPPAPKAEAPPTPPAGGQPLRLELNGKTVLLPPKASGEPHMLFDMLPLVDIDLQHPQGTVKVLVNGRSAPYQQPLASGDIIEIGWES